MGRSPAGAASAASPQSSNFVDRTTAVNNEMKYKGVRRRKWGKYVSEIRLPNCRDRIWLGSYDAAEKAARAFDAALFCLRGPSAKFNFPEDPPDIAGGQSLTPTEIQAVAQSYANGFGAAGASGDQTQQDAEQLEDTSPSSTSEGAGTADFIDWSFLDMLDSNEGRVSDYGLFDEPEDIYLTAPNFADRGNENEDNEEQGNGGNINVPSFLWNF